MEKAIEEELKGGDLKEEKAESKREGEEGIKDWEELRKGGGEGGRKWEKDRQRLPFHNIPRSIRLGTGPFPISVRPKKCATDLDIEK